jgi:hypothetical protein
MPPCLIGMEACVGAHHLSRKLNSLGHDARLMPAKYVRPYSKGQKNDFRDAEAVQWPTKKFVATKTAEQLDLQVAIIKKSATTALTDKFRDWENPQPVKGVDDHPIRQRIGRHVYLFVGGLEQLDVHALEVLDRRIVDLERFSAGGPRERQQDEKSEKRENERQTKGHPQFLLDFYNRRRLRPRHLHGDYALDKQ